MQISSSFTLHASSPSCLASDLLSLELDIDTMNTRILRAARVSNCWIYEFGTWNFPSHLDNDDYHPLVSCRIGGVLMISIVGPCWNPCEYWSLCGRGHQSHHLISPSHHFPLGAAASPDTGGERQWPVELQTKVKRRFAKLSQSQRSPY